MTNIIGRILQLAGLAHQKSLGKLLSDTFWVFFGVSGLILSALGMNMMLTRLLTKDSMGEYLFLTSLMNFLVIPAGRGMHQIMVREIARRLGRGEYGQAAGLFAPAIQLTLVSSLVVGTLAVVAGMAAGYSFLVMLSLALLTAFTAWLNIAGESLRGLGDYRSASVLNNILPRFIAMLLIIPCLARSMNLSEAHALGFLAAGSFFALALAFFRIFLWRAGVLLEHVSLRSSLRELNASAWPLLNIGLVWMILANMDLWVLRGLGEASEVAVYGTAARLAVSLALLQSILRSVFNPRIASLYAQGRLEELQTLLRLASFLAGLFAMCGAAAFILFGGPILGIFFGPGYEAGSAVLSVLSLGYIFDSAMGLAVGCLVMSGNQRPMAIASVAVLLLTLALTAPLVLFMGPLGIALAMSLSMLLRNVLAVYLTHRYMGIWTSAYWRPADLLRLRDLFRLMQLKPSGEPES